MDLRPLIRRIPDFPKTGVTFWDITPLLRSPDALRAAIDAAVTRYRGHGITKVVAPESRGFILASPIAIGLKAGFVPIRKPGKLPSDVVRQEYALEYGTNTVEMHADAIEAGDVVLLVDDVLATGGTAGACVELVKKQGGTVAGMFFLLTLSYLRGRDAVQPYDVLSLLELSAKDAAGT